jgi:hypothetical protein
MCGQAGVIKYGDKPIPEELVSLLLTGNEHRGNDATGMAILQADGSVDVFKDDEPAWKFVTSDEYKKWTEEFLVDDSWAVILHTRGATQGSPRDNKNNHPMYKGQGAIVHNGMIHNDDSLFFQMKFERGAETDSDLIRAFVDKFGITKDCIKEMNKIVGSMAGSAIHPDFPNRVLLYRSGSPMTLGSNEDFFVWSSEKNTIHRAMRPWLLRFGTYFQEQRPDIAFAPFPDDTAWIMSKDGLEFHDRLKTLRTTYQEPFRKTYEQYHERNTRWDNEELRKKNVTQLASSTTSSSSKKWDKGYCIRCKRYWMIPKGEQPHNFRCEVGKKKGCGDLLSELPLVNMVK